MTIHKSWQKISNWLSLNAPLIMNESMNSPASTQEIADLKRIMQTEIPEDFLELYKIANGQNENENTGNMFYGFSFYSIAEIIQNHEDRLRYGKDGSIPLKNASLGINISNINNPNWLAIGNDGSRCTLNLDLNPSEDGTYGQIIFLDGTYDIAILLAKSTTELLANFALDLNNGTYFLEPDALEDGYHFLSPIASIDVDNWWKAEQWKALWVE